MKLRSPHLARIVALSAGIAVVSSLLVSVSTPAPTQAAPVAAVTAGAASPVAAKVNFSPGEIITDPLMYDFGTMSASSIQKFLNKQVKKCSSKSQAPCLRNYKVKIKKTIVAEQGRCDNTIYKNNKKQTAAQIIAIVAKACKVNPQVLLVTLQKEQGLVTAKTVTKLTYRKSTGYGCPDSSECDKEFYGFVNQVYWAARAYNAYFNFPDSFRFQPGKTLEVNYSPKKGCGTKKVYIENRATAALYNYTPYTPNASSLAHPYKTGNSCSSYGNRNFFLYYNKWFGNSTVGQYFVGSGSSTYLVANGSRWKLPASSARLKSALAPLGSTGKITSSYLSSLTNKGTLSPIIRLSDNATKFYLVAGKTKYTLGSCAEVTALGFSCDVPSYYPADVAALTTKTDLLGKSAVQVRTADSAKYLLANGVRRQILNPASVSAESLALGTLIDLDLSAISSIPSGRPVAQPDSLIVSSSTGAGYYITAAGDTTYSMPKTLLAETGAKTWFGGVDGTLDGSSVAKLPGLTPLPAIFTGNGASFLLGKSGRTTLVNPAQFATSIPELDAAIVAKIPPVSGSLTAPVIVTTPAAATPSLVNGARKRALVSKADVAAIAAASGASTTVATISSAALAAITAGTTVLPPGTVVQATTSTATWFIDGPNSKVAISSDQVKELVGKITPRKVSAKAVAGYTVVSGKVPPGVTCGTDKYLAIGGTLRKVTPEVATAFGAKFGFRSLHASSCAALKLSGVSGTLIKVGSVYYSVENGKKRKLTTAQYTTLAQDSIAAKTVSSYFSSLLPTTK